MPLALPFFVFLFCIEVIAVVLVRIDVIVVVAHRCIPLHACLWLISHVIWGAGFTGLTPRQTFYQNNPLEFALRTYQQEAVMPPIIRFSAK